MNIQVYALERHAPQGHHGIAWYKNPSLITVDKNQGSSNPTVKLPIQSALLKLTFLASVNLLTIAPVTEGELPKGSQ